MAVNVLIYFNSHILIYLTTTYDCGVINEKPIGNYAGENNRGII